MNNSLHEIINQFSGAMASAGIVTNDCIIADGQLHRIHVEGQRHGTLNGAYVLHGDGKAAGWFQNFVDGTTGTWRIGGGRWEIDQATRRQIEESKKARQVEREAYNAKKAGEACRIWSAATPCNEHPYLARKGIQSHGLRSGNWRKWIKIESGFSPIDIEGVLLVPVISPDNNLVNVQAIFPEANLEIGRDKDYLGGRKKGCFFWIGEPTDTILIAEGYATAASLHEQTGHQVIIAFDCGNLMDVAIIVRKAHPGATIIIAGDNDRKTPGNPGLTKAREAALAVGGKLLIPKFEDGEIGSDWNDWITSRRFSGSLKNEDFDISPLGSFTGMEAQHGGK
jgi:putative DNA primase/helicase